MLEEINYSLETFLASSTCIHVAFRQKCIQLYETRFLKIEVSAIVKINAVCYFEFIMT